MQSPSAHGHSKPPAGATNPEPGGSLGARSAPAAEERTSAASASTTTGPAAVERFWADLSSLRAAGELLIATRGDQVKLSLRRAFLLGIVIGLAILGLAIVAASACVMVVIGIAGGLGEWLGSVWLGQLLTGMGLVIGGSLLLFVLLRIARQRSRRKTLERYGKVAR
jgi:hypothetical protein